ncbi:hypothetical protein Acr_01g0008760 [Actinidia rufa]|uniref:Uncharacterized protein n=1 Tax=Actinidia rufa TaxID=165716 RepID=A0A7J0E5W7_9ERIC|nr:hypothetical protein Acr_01g0008760 [Actinidia rufa]
MPEPHETRLPMGKPISKITLRMSNAHLGVAPPPPQLSPYTMDIDSLDDEVPPLAATNFPSISTASTTTSIAVSNSKIVDAITSLFAHMNMIHIDLVECIGQVHE